MVIAVDFDGTCVTHEYPHVGEDIGAQPVLRKLVEAGHQLILFTMRSGKELQDAVKWFKNNDIPLYGVNANPTQSEWTKSPKAYAQLYIDDAALGIPLDVNVTLVNHEELKQIGRPFVNWEEVEKLLKDQDIIN
jgi:hypothetical protein